MVEPSPHRLSLQRLIPLGLLVVAGAAFVLSGGRHYLAFTALTENRAFLYAMAARGSVLTMIGFILAYAALTALSIPGALIMTLVGGFLFGLWLGALYALTGATLGATAVFLAARTGLSSLVARAGPRVQGLEAEFREDAFNYLLCLRLVPIFPFWLVNLVAGVAGMRLWSYVVATFVGMIPGALVYAGLGSGMGAMIANRERPDLHLVFRPSIFFPLLGLAALALLPVIYRRWTARRGQPAR